MLRLTFSFLALTSFIWLFASCKMSLSCISCTICSVHDVSCKSKSMWTQFNVTYTINWEHVYCIYKLKVMNWNLRLCTKYQDFLNITKAQEHNSVPSQGSNPDCLTWRWAHWPWGHAQCLHNSDAKVRLILDVGIHKIWLKFWTLHVIQSWVYFLKANLPTLANTTL